MANRQPLVERTRDTESVGEKQSKTPGRCRISDKLHEAGTGTQTTNGVESNHNLARAIRVGLHDQLPGFRSPGTFVGHMASMPNSCCRFCVDPFLLHASSQSQYTKLLKREVTFAPFKLCKRRGTLSVRVTKHACHVAPPIRLDATYAIQQTQ